MTAQSFTPEFIRIISRFAGLAEALQHGNSSAEHEACRLAVEAQGAIASADFLRAVAAPDLLDALLIYAETYNEHWERGMPILEPIADAAIAKARGKVK